jgi:hypothetical protein
VPELLTAEAFQPHVGTQFRVPGVPEGAELALALAEIERHPPQPGLEREPFALVFTGPPEAPLDQRTYRLEHDDMDAFDIFLVPIGPGPEGLLRYEAVFS